MNNVISTTEFERQLHAVLTDAQIAELSPDELAYMAHPVCGKSNKQFIAGQYIRHLFYQFTGIKYQYVSDDHLKAETFAGFDQQITRLSQLPVVNKLYFSVYKWTNKTVIDLQAIGIDFTLNGYHGYTVVSICHFPDAIDDDINQMFKQNWDALKDDVEDVAEYQARIPMNKIRPFITAAKKRDRVRAAASVQTPVYYYD